MEWDDLNEHPKQMVNLSFKERGFFSFLFRLALLRLNSIVSSRESERDMHLYNAWLPAPVAEETRREKEAFARLVASVRASYRRDDPDSVYATLKWVSVVDLCVLSLSLSLSRFPFLVFTVSLMCDSFYYDSCLSWYNFD